MEYSRRNIGIFFIATLVLTIFCYAPSITGEFLNWDDESYVPNNYLLSSFSIVDVFTSYYMGNYHPLTILSYYFEYSFFGVNSAVYHLTNIFLHAVNTILVLLLIKNISDLKLGVLSAVVFCIHPMHVESVAWISERKDVLYSLFFLLSVLFYMRSKSSINKYYFLALFTFLLSLLSKGQGVVLSGLLIVYDLLFRSEKISLPWLLKIIPFIALSLVFGLIAIDAQSDAHAVNNTLNYSAFEKGIMGTYSFGLYILKLAIPFKLAAIYPYPFDVGESISLHIYLTAAISFMFLITLIICRKNRILLFSLIWFLLSLIPVLQFFPVGEAIIADRYSYIASIGFFLFVFTLIKQIIPIKLRSKHKFFLTLAIIYFGILSNGAFSRSKVWNNKLDFWTDQIEKQPSYGKGYNNLASYYYSVNEVEKAKTFFQKSIKNKCYLAYLGLSIIADKEGNKEQAKALADNAIKVFPYWVDAYSNRARLLINSKKYTQAFDDYRKCYHLSSYKGQYLSSIGDVHYLTADYDSALFYYDKAILNNYKSPITYLNRGKTHIKLNNAQEAINNISKSIKLNPEPHFEAYSKLASILFIAKMNSQGLATLAEYISKKPDDKRAILLMAQKQFSIKQYDNAINSFTRLVNLNMNDYESFNNRGLANQFSGNYNEALVDYTKAIQIKPDFVDAYYNRGRTHTLLENDNMAIVDYQSVLKLKPSHTASYKFLAISQLNIGAKESACENYNKIKSTGFKGDLSLLEKVCN